MITAEEYSSTQRAFNRVGVSMPPIPGWTTRHFTIRRYPSCAAFLAARSYYREGGRITVADIQRLVCGRFKVPLAEMTSRRRSRKVARPRQVAMYLARELTPNSYPEIGRRFGGRDHSTVMYACWQVARLSAGDSDFAAGVAELRRELEG